MIAILARRPFAMSSQNMVGFNPLQGSEKENIAAITSEVSSLGDGRRKIQGALSELMEGRKAEQGDRGPMIAEKEEIRRKIQEKMQELNTLRDDYRVKETEYRTYMDKVRVEHQKMYIVQREASNKEYDLIRRQRAVEKLDEQPFVSEITLIEQTMAFCKTLTATKGGEEKKEVKETVTGPAEGPRAQRESPSFAPRPGPAGGAPEQGLLGPPEARRSKGSKSLR